MPLFTSLPAPYALYDQGVVWGAAAAVASTANTIWLVGVTLNAPVTLTGFRVEFGTGGAGNYDAGIYDSSAAGNLLTHVGSTATASGVQSPTLATPFPLSSGSYWLAFWINNTTDTVFRAASIANASISKGGTSATGLPTTFAGITALANNNRGVLIFGLLSGGWS